MKDHPYRIVFLNQVVGPLYRELAEDVADAMGSSLLITGRDKLFRNPKSNNLTVEFATAYDRSSHSRRLITWICYFYTALIRTFLTDRESLLFIVSNPPFLALIGWLAAIFRGQRYVLLIYDIYPGLLEGLGRLRKNGWVVRLWNLFNRLVWTRADVIFTIGDYMATNLRVALITVRNPPDILIIPNWADGDFIKPRDKVNNWFALRYGQEKKITVMYSGNVGDTHDLTPLLDTAHELEADDTIHFLIIGGGSQWPSIQKHVKTLPNVTLLPYQPEEHLPFSMSTADVAVVILESGVEGYSVPSKTYYALAAGAALLVISNGPNELTEIVEREACGLVAEPQSVESILKALLRFRQDPNFLSRCKNNARTAMERHYSRQNTLEYVITLEALLIGSTTPTR